MNEILPEFLLEPSPSASLSSTTTHEIGFDSTAAPIAQQQLNDVRKAFLASPNLPANHDFRKRANEADGTLLPKQPNGTPRKAYEPHKIPRPRIRKDKEAATYFLERQRLVNMWNGKWTTDEDWAAWDDAKDKMEKQFSIYRLIEQPVLKRRKEKEYQKREKKRKRDQESSEVEHGGKKRCLGKTGRPTRPFPLPSEVLALTPPEGVRMERLLETFYGCDGYDTERFCGMLHEIGNLNKYTKMFTRGKTDMGHRVKSIFPFTGGPGDIPIDPALLNMSSGNACIKDARVEVF
jgi:hypothetical protein